MDNLKSTGQNLGRVFNSRSGCMCAMHLICYESKQPNLKLKTLPKQLLGSLPRAFALPAYCLSDARHNIRVNYLFDLGEANFGDGQRSTSGLGLCMCHLDTTAGPKLTASGFLCPQVRAITRVGRVADKLTKFLKFDRTVSSKQHISIPMYHLMISIDYSYLLI